MEGRKGVGRGSPQEGRRGPDHALWVSESRPPRPVNSSWGGAPEVPGRGVMRSCNMERPDRAGALLLLYFFTSTPPPGGGNSRQLQYSCLENSMDRGAWWATQSMGRKESNTTEQLTLHFRPHLGPWGACATSEHLTLPEDPGPLPASLVSSPCPPPRQCTGDKCVMTTLTVLLTLPTRDLDALLWLHVGVGYGGRKNHIHMRLLQAALGIALAWEGLVCLANTRQ